MTVCNPPLIYVPIVRFSLEKENYYSVNCRLGKPIKFALKYVQWFDEFQPCVRSQIFESTLLWRNGKTNRGGGAP